MTPGQLMVLLFLLVLLAALTSCWIVDHAV
jgi:hypothetical protein